jgi:hypothetical protein
LEGLMMYFYAQHVYRLPANGSRLLVAIAMLCTVLSVTQLSLAPRMQMLATSASCIVGLLVVWGLGRRNLRLLKVLLCAVASN